MRSKQALEKGNIMLGNGSAHLGDVVRRRRWKQAEVAADEVAEQGSEFGDELVESMRRSTGDDDLVSDAADSQMSGLDDQTHAHSFSGKCFP
jgi:hypothetical protein